MGFLLRLTIPGEAVPWAAPDVVPMGAIRAGKKKPKQRNNFAVIHEAAARAMAEAGYDRPFDGPVVIGVYAYRAKGLKSMSKAKKALALADQLRPATRPDSSNIRKQVEDALNGVVYTDDARVVRGVDEKRFAEVARLDIVVQEWKPRG